MKRGPGTKAIAVLFAVAAVSVSHAGLWRSIPVRSGEAQVVALAFGDSSVAAGLSEGGLRIAATKGRASLLVEERAFGARGRIADVAWLAGRYVVASEEGLHFVDARTGRVERVERGGGRALLEGVQALRVRGYELWMVGKNGVAVLDGAGGGDVRSWGLPSSGDVPCAILPVGSTIIVGTAGAGLLLLDASSGTWTRIGVEDGLPDGQVRGLELVGSRVFVATPRGLAVVELPSRVAKVAVAGLAANSMTQVNGALVVSTAGGFLSVDGATLRSKPFDVDSGWRPDGAVAFGKGFLATGGPSGTILVRTMPTFLGTSAMLSRQDGLLSTIPAPLPKGAKIVAQLRIPEWLAASIPVDVAYAPGARNVLLRFPSGTTGRFVLEMAVTMGETVLERRTLDVATDRVTPMLEIDPVPGWQRDSVVRIQGTARAAGGVAVFRWGDSRPIDLSADGRFSVEVPIRRGRNLVRFRAFDDAGNVSVREVGVARDDSAPFVEMEPLDTVDDDRIQARFRLFERNLSKVEVEPRLNAVAIATDSSVVVDLKNLVPGRNAFALRVDDLAGNRVVRRFVVVRRGGDGENASAESKVSADVRCADTARIHVLRYGMIEGESISKVAERFYGNREMAAVLIEWNGLKDSTSWRRMPVGTKIDIPVWRDIELDGDVNELISTMPRRRRP